MPQAYSPTGTSCNAPLLVGPSAWSLLSAEWCERLCRSVRERRGPGELAVDKSYLGSTIGPAQEAIMQRIALCMGWYGSYAAERIDRNDLRIETRSPYGRVCTSERSTA